MHGVPTGNVRRLVWDTSALLNIKQTNGDGYSPGFSLYKDLVDGWIEGPHFNIYPAIAVYELQASISRLHREGKKILRDFYILSEHSVVYPIDHDLIRRSAPLLTTEGFTRLRGADLIFACIAKLEDATLVTLDKGFTAVMNQIDVLDLNDSIDTALYRSRFEMKSLQ